MILRERVAERVGAFELPAAPVHVEEKPAVVEEPKLATDRERLLNRDAGELSRAPEIPPIAERHPLDQNLSGDALFEHRLVDVPRRERILNDLAGLLVGVANRRLLTSDPPSRHDGPANLRWNVEEHAIFSDPLRARKKEVDHFSRGSHASGFGAAMLLHREAELGDSVFAIVTSVLRRHDLGQSEYVWIRDQRQKRGRGRF